MMSGEYFLSDKAKDDLKKKNRREEKMARKQEKIDTKAREFEAPEEYLPAKKDKKAKKEKSEEKEQATSSKQRPDIEDLKNKFLKKRKKVE